MKCSVDSCGNEAHAKTWCFKHYNRFRIYGRLDRINEIRGEFCSVEGCDKSVKGKGLCHNHNMMRLKYGRTNKLDRKLRSHPFYIIWWQRKKDKVLCERWLDFNNFIIDVSPKPEGEYFLVRLRNEPFGPDNFKWQEHLKRKEDEAKKDWWARKREARIAANPSMESDRNIKRRFNLSRDQYRQMLWLQNGGCAICNQKETAVDARTGTIKSLSVDHCHNNNKIRGLLCFRCNATIGKLEDNIELLDAMKIYLLKHKGN